MNKTEFVIDKKLLPLIATLTAQDNNSLSPWAAFDKVSASELLNDSLLQAGITDSSGSLNGDYGHVIEMLQRPVRFTRMRLLSGSMILDQIVYSCSPEGEQVAITPAEDSIHVAWPAPVVLVMAAFREYWGSGVLVSSKLNIETEPHTALVFAAISDLHRRSYFADKVAMQSSGSKMFNISDIKDCLTNTPPDGQWLVTVLKQATEECGQLEIDLIHESLNQLIALQVLEKRENAYCLVNDGLSFANSFLLIAQTLTLEIGALKENGEVVQSSMLCLQAGLHDNLCIESDGDMVSLEAVSASYIGSILEAFMTAVFSEEDLALSQENISDEPPPIIKPEKTETESSISKDTVQWFIGVNQENYGPYTWEQMQKFASDGTINSASQVWHKGMPDWSTAVKIEGLF
jgi:hypothetical protein